MRGLKTTKYMQIFTAIGYVIGFLIIIVTSVTNTNKLYVIVGLIIIFLGRFIGYGIDRIVEYRDEKKK